METSVRLLRLLSILQTGRDWTAEELADRLGVTTRTVRNDVGRLRNLGYRIESMRGPGGGYWLGRGVTTPPLLLDDDEAVAITLALRTGARTSVTGMEEAGVRALVKLQQMLPSRLQSRLAALEAYVEPVSRPGPAVAIDLLVQIAIACRNRETLRFQYQRHDETAGRRLVEPHRLVNDGRRWYLLGWDLDREDWRSFRVDRVSESRIRPGPRFPIREVPDPAHRVARGAATAMWHYRARVIAHAPAEELIARLPTAVQVEPVDEQSCRLHVGSSSPEMLAAYLGLLGVDFTVEDSVHHPELITALGVLADRLRRAGR